MNDPSNLQFALSISDSGDRIRFSNDTFYIDDPIEIKSGITLEGGYVTDLGWSKTSEVRATHIIRSIKNPEGTDAFS